MRVRSDLERVVGELLLAALTLEALLAPGEPLLDKGKTVCAAMRAGLRPHVLKLAVEKKIIQNDALNPVNLIVGKLADRFL